ncbi:MAG: STAS domain-containing protein [Armatimonadetes bacterium]|nr:STAS domain-containing protein [Armatimonadota bacterium]
MSTGANAQNGIVLSHRGNVLSVRGAVDLGNVSLLLGALKQLRDAHPVVVLDASEITYMDSTGFGVLLRVCRELRHRGGRLVLRRPAPHIRRMLEVTEMLHLFTFE